jgi:hypothetical protein
MLTFPNSGSGKPYINLDARTGMFKISSPDGAQMKDMQGQAIGMDIANTTQGWLHVSAGGADWRPITDGQWGMPPSPDHKPGAQLDVVLAGGDVRELRGNSKAIIGFVQSVAQAASEAGATTDGPIPLVRIDKVVLVKIGQGTSVNIAFTLAPKEKWIARSTLDGAAAGAPFDEPTKPAPKAASKVDPSLSF